MNILNILNYNQQKNIALYKNSTALYKKLQNYDEMFLSNPYVKRCVTLISNAVSNVDYCFKKNKIIVNHDILEKLFEQPNEQDSWPSFIENIIINYIVYGNAFVYLEKINNDQYKLYNLDSKSVNVCLNKNKIEYKYKAENTTYKFDNADFPYIMHFKNLNPTNSVYGVSMLESAQISATLQNDIDLHNLSIIQNGGRVSGIISIKNKASLNQDEREALSRILIEEYKGPGNAGKVALVSGDVEWVDMTKNKEMDFSNASKRSIQSIAASLGVPSILLGITAENESSKANMEFVIKNFEQNTILPIVRKLFGFLNIIVKKIDKEIEVDYINQFNIYDFSNKQA